MLCEHCQSEIKDRRTSQQNRALHLYFTLLADALNEAGFDMRETIRQDVEIPWTPDTIKENLWRPIQKAYFKKQSTAHLKKKEIDKVYDVLNKTIGERTGVHIDFPNQINLIDYEKK